MLLAKNGYHGIARRGIKKLTKRESLSVSTVPLSLVIPVASIVISFLVLSALASFLTRTSIQLKHAQSVGDMGFQVNILDPIHPSLPCLLPFLHVITDSGIGKSEQLHRLPTGLHHPLCPGPSDSIIRCKG